MVETGEDLRLPREPGEAIRVSREGVGQDLQRDLAVELGVARGLQRVALAIDSASVIWRGTDPRQGVAVVSTEAPPPDPRATSR